MLDSHGVLCATGPSMATCMDDDWAGSGLIADLAAPAPPRTLERHAPLLASPAVAGLGDEDDEDGEYEEDYDDDDEAYDKDYDEDEDDEDYDDDEDFEFYDEDEDDEDYDDDEDEDDDDAYFGEDDEDDI